MPDDKKKKPAEAPTPEEALRARRARRKPFRPIGPSGVGERLYQRALDESDPRHRKNWD